MKYCCIAFLSALVVACGGSGGGGATSTSSNVPSKTFAVVPYKGMFISGQVVVVDALGRIVATAQISAQGSALAVVPDTAVYPLTYKAQGTYVDEATGSSSITTDPIRAVVADAETAAKGVAVTLMTEFAAALVDQKILNGEALNSVMAKSSLTTIASAVLGLTYEEATALPVFDANGKTTDPNTLKLAALALAANTLGQGADLVAKVKSLSALIATGRAVDAVIPQSAFDAVWLWSIPHQASTDSCRQVPVRFPFRPPCWFHFL